MGIIKAALDTIGGSLADQWLEVLEPDEMDDTTVFTRGVKVRTKRGQNYKSSDNAVSNGSVIHVYPNQFMLLVDGGKIVDYTAEEGYYTVNNSSLPSLFNGELDETLRETFNRFAFGGTSPVVQKVYYVNLQEIKGIKFGTRNPINYFDNFYNAELFLRAHGVYSIKITDPLLFYAEAIPRSKDRVKIDDINTQYLSEFLEAFQSAINQMSVDGIRISYVSSKGRELSQYMANSLDDDWKKMRGMEVQSVGISSISYDEQSTKLINMRNEGAMLSSPDVAQGYMAGAAARGIEAAGSNPGGSMAGFMGINMASQAAGGFMAGMQSMQKPAPVQNGWVCSCGKTNSGKFCSDCGKPKPESDSWVCPCGKTNVGKFCSDCGKPKPAGGKTCPKCNHVFEVGEDIPKFCPECGSKIES